jgi:hypothetical protein
VRVHLKLGNGIWCRSSRRFDKWRKTSIVNFVTCKACKRQVEWERKCAKQHREDVRENKRIRAVEGRLMWQGILKQGMEDEQ